MQVVTYISYQPDLNQDSYSPFIGFDNVLEKVTEHLPVYYRKIW